MKGVAIPGFKINTSGKVVRDHTAAKAKLNVSLRLKRATSKKVRVVAKRGRS